MKRVFGNRIPVVVCSIGGEHVQSEGLVGYA